MVEETGFVAASISGAIDAWPNNLAHEAGKRNIFYSENC